MLLIGCANVTVLLTVRASQRRREFAVRKTLGATAARVTRAVMAEAMVAGLAAAALKGWRHVPVAFTAAGRWAVSAHRPRRGSRWMSSSQPVIEQARWFCGASR